jgi:hypothetical protein
MVGGPSLERLGALVGSTTAAKLLENAVPAIGLVGLAAQMPSWRRDEWIGGSVTFAATYAAASLVTIPVLGMFGPVGLASLVTTAAAGRVGRGIRKGAQLFRRKPQERRPLGHRLGDQAGSLADQYRPLLDFAQTVYQQTPIAAQQPAAKKQRR